MASINKQIDSNGQTSYRVRVRLKGHPIQSATFKRLTDAKKWASKTETDIREGRYFPKREAQKKTVSELITQYKSTILPHKALSTQKAQRFHFEWWNNEIGSLTLAALKSARIAECRDKLVSGGLQPATANRYMAALSHALSWAVKEKGWIDTNVCLNVTKGKESRGVVRFLSNDEINDRGEVVVEGERTRLLNACKASRCPLLYPAVLLSMSTGMRIGEQMTLTWKDVDLGTGRIILNKTKNKERRTAVATGPALDELKKLAKVRRIDSDLLFPGKKGTPITLSKPWTKAREDAEVESFRWHDLRHSFASELAMSGATLSEISEAMGHKTLAMVKRYSHLTEGHISSVVERMTSRVFGEK